jgi:hypothetical protein
MGITCEKLVFAAYTRYVAIEIGKHIMGAHRHNLAIIP